VKRYICTYPNDFGGVYPADSHEDAHGGWVSYDDAARLEKQAADWEHAYRAGRETYRDIGAILGADMPRELLVDVARQRMARIAGASAAADELRDMVTAGAEMTAQLLARITELEAAIDKLAQCKGRYHTEANYKALIEVCNKSLHK
jgi:hypothetical protein